MGAFKLRRSKESTGSNPAATQKQGGEEPDKMQLMEFAFRMGQTAQSSVSSTAPTPQEPAAPAFPALQDVPALPGREADPKTTPCAQVRSLAKKHGFKELFRRESWLEVFRCRGRMIWRKSLNMMSKNEWRARHQTWRSLQNVIYRLGRELIWKVDQTEEDPVRKMQLALKLREETKGKGAPEAKLKKSPARLGAKPKASSGMKKPASSMTALAKAKAKNASKFISKGHANKAGYIFGLTVWNCFFFGS